MCAGNPTVSRWRLFCLFCVLFGSPNVTVAEVIFDWVTVGDPDAPSSSTALGRVDYPYRISKYEVTNSQYNEFLNAVKDVGNGLYDPEMSASANGGILRFGVGTNENPFRYEVKSGLENKPVVFVDILGVMAFVNWLAHWAR